MQLNAKGVLYKHMFIVSTVSGALGIYSLYKGAAVLGWILIGVWAVLGALVRILMMRDKRNGRE